MASTNDTPGTTVIIKSDRGGRPRYKPAYREEVLDARTGSGDADAQRLRFLRDDGHALEECCVALSKLAGGGERLGTG